MQVGSRSALFQQGRSVCFQSLLKLVFTHSVSTVVVVDGFGHTFLYQQGMAHIHVIGSQQFAFVVEDFPEVFFSLLGVSGHEIAPADGTVGIGRGFSKEFYFEIVFQGFLITAKCCQAMTSLQGCVQIVGVGFGYFPVISEGFFVLMQLPVALGYVQIVPGVASGL